MCIPIHDCVHGLVRGSVDMTFLLCAGLCFVSDKIARRTLVIKQNAHMAPLTIGSRGHVPVWHVIAFAICLFLVGHVGWLAISALRIEMSFHLPFQLPYQPSTPLYGSNFSCKSSRVTTALPGLGFNLGARAVRLYNVNSIWERGFPDDIELCTTSVHLCTQSFTNLYTLCLHPQASAFFQCPYLLQE